MLSVCTSSTQEQLARLGDLLVLLGTTASSSGQDIALTRATRWVETYLTGEQGGSIRRQVYQESIAGYGSQRLMTSRTPLASIQRMFDDTSTGDATEYCSTDRRIENADAGFIELTNVRTFAWDAIDLGQVHFSPLPSAANRRWLVVYEAGWQLECSSTANDWLTTTTGQTLPGDVEHAILMKAAELYQGSAAGVESMQVGPLRMNWSSEASDPVIDILSPYRRVQ